jgi:nucleoside-diphosphate-sugar epimerase
MSERPTVLVAGVTGMMGHKITSSLLDRNEARVRAIVRPGGYTGDKQQQIDILRDRGVEMVEADLKRPDTLPAACAGADVVVSAVQGLREIIVDGQTNLLQAAESVGVKRLIPSDFGVDLFKLEPGENRNMDLRREFSQRLDESSVAGTSILIGSFTEMLAMGFPPLDTETGTFDVWGDGEQPMDFTTTDDTAVYTAAAALDNEAPRVLRFAGDSVTLHDLQAIFEKTLDRTLEQRDAGTVEDLAREIERAKQENPGGEDEIFPGWQGLQYLHNMVSGRGKLWPLDNARYPDVQPTGVREFLTRAWR